MTDGNEKMSDSSESGSENGNASDICRDFLRNVCRRGKLCKFRHPGEPESCANKKISEYTFCHDFQNNGCHRPNCKFLHCTKEEEDRVRLTGELPSRVIGAASIGIRVDHAEMVVKSGVPLCKDYLKDECHRGQQCKYRHILSAEYNFLQQRAEYSKAVKTRQQRHELFSNFDLENINKKRRLSCDKPEERLRSFDSPYAPIAQHTRHLNIQLIEEENVMLRKKIDDLKKHVADLTATNEVLLEQNARYRVSKSNILQSNDTLDVHAAYQAASLSHLNQNIAHQIALNNDVNALTQQHQHQALQRIVQEAAALAATRCNIAGQQSHNSVALPMHPPPVVTLSFPQSISGLQSNNNPSSTQNSSDIKTTLVSYPIISQGMRMSAGNVAH